MSQMMAEQVVMPAAKSNCVPTAVTKYSPSGEKLTDVTLQPGTCKGFPMHSPVSVFHVLTVPSPRRSRPMGSQWLQDAETAPSRRGTQKLVNALGIPCRSLAAVSRL